MQCPVQLIKRIDENSISSPPEPHFRPLFSTGLAFRAKKLALLKYSHIDSVCNDNLGTVIPITNGMQEQRKSYVGRVVQQLGANLRSFIRRRVRSQDDAEDVLQDVWHQLLDAASDGPIEHVAAWLYTVARNRIIDQYRRRSAQSLNASEIDAEELQWLGMMPDQSQMGDETRAVWWSEFTAALAELPAEQRQVFLWHESDGLTFQQISQRTGENINTLLSRKRYAVLHLRKKLEDLRDNFYS